jgi:hypothetical protein
MYGSAAYPVSREVSRAPSRGRTRNQEFPLRLFAPVGAILTDGGDDRLWIPEGHMLNGYGCAAVPVPHVLEFASSTASTISERSYARARRMRVELLADAKQQNFFEAFDARLETLRGELRRHLGLESISPDIVFAASGTDASLLASALGQSHFGGAVTHLIVLSQETGSGVPLAAGGRHFSTRTALGDDVEKGAIVEGFDDRIATREIVARDEFGRPLSPAHADILVIDEVAAAVRRGERVLLHAMDFSKTGLGAPSLACLDEIAGRWPDEVLILVDACQLRLSCADLALYLARNFLVTITGSKFFMGPAFSGALLVPRTMSKASARSARLPEGIEAYSSRASWPHSWKNVRRSLRAEANLGEWLRWETALAEMDAYFAVPTAFRKEFVRSAGTEIRDRTKALKPVRLVDSGTLCDAPTASEMDSQTVFPFSLHRRGQALPVEETRAIYRQLNKRIEAAVSAKGAAFHIGQPVGVEDGEGSRAGALRVSLGARNISDAWISGDRAQSQKRLEATIEAMGDAIEETARLAKSL